LQSLQLREISFLIFCCRHSILAFAPENIVRKRTLTISLIALHAVILLAGFIAPYDPASQNRAFAYSPPSRIQLRDTSGFHLRPFLYASASEVNGYDENPSLRFPVRFLCHGDKYKLLGFVPTDVHLFGVTAPEHIFILGTDGYGRDQFSRLLYGGQISLAAGLLATLITLTMAAFVGTVSGYFGKWTDESLMGLAELFVCLPWFYFLIAVRAFLPLHLSPANTFSLIICVTGAIGWGRPARLVRGVVLSARNRDYVLAARGFGASDCYLLWRHVAPEAFGVLLTQAALLVPQYVAAEAVLSFFGLGIAEPVPSWGNMLSALQQYNIIVSYQWLLAPAAALVITSVIYWLLADALHHWVKSHSV
jgi:peptide/nickel transport system permease protein